MCVHISFWLCVCVCVCVLSVEGGGGGGGGCEPSCCISSSPRVPTLLFSARLSLFYRSHHMLWLVGPFRGRPLKVRARNTTSSNPPLPSPSPQPPSSSPAADQATKSNDTQAQDSVTAHLRCPFCLVFASFLISCLISCFHIFSSVSFSPMTAPLCMSSPSDSHLVSANAAELPNPLKRRILMHVVWAQFKMWNVKALI